MTANIAAIRALFGSRTPTKQTTGTGTPSFLPGPTPYVWALANGCGDWFEDAFVSVVEAIRSDARWGPLFDGDLSPYKGNHSSGDMALCGEFACRGFDAHFIDMAIRSSKLYRQKWEDRDDYRERTITKALANAPAPAPVAPTTAALDPLGGRIKISCAAPPPRDYIIDGLLVPSKVVTLGGFGGVSKSQLAIQVAVAISLGQPFLSKFVKAGNVLAIFGEEDQNEIERRTGAVAFHQNLQAADMTKVEDGFRVYPMVGEDVRLTARDGKALVDTKFAQKVIDCATAVGDVRLIILDHLSLFHGGDFNAREDAALTMRIANQIGHVTGAAVMMLAHTPKNASGKEESDASMIAGSTAFVDQSRAAWVLATMRESEAKKFGIQAAQRGEFVSLSVVKSNYGPTGECFWFKRVVVHGCAVLEPVTFSKQAAQSKSFGGLETRISVFVSTHRGQFSKSKLRDLYSGKKMGPLKASKGAIELTIDKMLAGGDLLCRPPTDAERKLYGHGPRVTQVLDIP